MKLIITLAILAIFVGLLSAQISDAKDSREGNNGRCRKLQSTFPEELQDYQGCKDTFTHGNKHDMPPLP